MEDALKDAILRSLTKDDILELFNEAKTADSKEHLANNPLTPQRKYYLTRKIPGSNLICSNCGQDMVNDEQHAIELLGGENN